MQNYLGSLSVFVPEAEAGHIQSVLPGCTLYTIDTLSTEVTAFGKITLSAMLTASFFLFAGAAPLSAPAFSLVFPLLKTVMTETSHDGEDKEEFLVKILQILTVHAQLRSSATGQALLVDEVSWSCGDEMSFFNSCADEAGAKQLVCDLDKAD